MESYNYNMRAHEATRMNPFKELFGADAFETDHELSPKNRIYQKPGHTKELTRALDSFQRQLIEEGLRACD